MFELPERIRTLLLRLIEWMYYWERTWYAPCDDLNEFRNLQRVSPDRLQVVPAPAGRPGNALRVEVRNNDQVPATGVNWRAEAIGPEESQSITLTKFRWLTYFDPAYPRNPVSPEGAVWQVFFQWHQADDPPDAGTSPPVEFIVEPGPAATGKLYLSLNRPDANDPTKSVQVAKRELADLTPGSWHEFDVEILWHMTKGSIRVVHNGVEVVPPISAQTIFPKLHISNVPGCTYMKAGLYRKRAFATNNGQPVGDPPNVGFILYHDELERFERRRRFFPSPWPLALRSRGRK